MNNLTNPTMPGPYIRFVSLTEECNEEFYVNNLKKFSPKNALRTSDYRKCGRGEIRIGIKDKNCEKLLCDSSEILMPGEICTFVTLGTKEKCFLKKIKEALEIRSPEYGYLKICYHGSDEIKINIMYKNSCFCRDIKSGDVSKYIGFVPGEYVFTVQDNKGESFATAERVTIEKGKCCTMYVTTDKNGIFKTLITSDIGNPECY